MAEIDEKLTQAGAGLGCPPVRPQQRAQFITAHRLAVCQRKTGKQTHTLIRPERDRNCRQGLEFRRPEELEPVFRHEICSNAGAFESVVRTN